ncbi:MAG: sensor histidine kinase, partial [Saprospiraceae bacterium]|nr:sensor histidine kinase [Saprospiraceae bacterium]
HDGLGGILSNIKSQLHALEHKVDELAGYDLYGKASGMIDSASKEVRRIATNMMPLALAKLGLKAAIEDLVSKVEQNHPISINLHITSLKGRLEQTKEIMTYRIIQELVNNVIKHAGASTLLLQLDDVNGDLLLTVEDNGKGFNYQEALNAQGIGMKSILSRVKYLKGELDVSSSSQGTCVVVHIPGKTCSKVN